MKKSTKKIISGVSKLISKPNPVNIYYHDITLHSGESYMRINKEKFYSQMKFLYENNYETLLFSDIKKGNNPTKKSILISFDDGFESNYEYGMSILKKFGIKANIFLTLDYIGKEGYLTWDMVKEMHDSGLIEFGAHTKTHLDSRLINSNNFKEEIRSVNENIEKHCGYQVEDFCFPYGIYNRKVLKYFNDFGIYKRVYTSDMCNPKKMSFLKPVGRIGIRDEDDLEDFSNKVKGNYVSIYYLKRLRRLFNYNGI
ncbi:polysaccharide deacetylase family protein [Virgibacillus ihumii]|uniref:polysaccharide deacetylase family protein n=1 Tax=Virgibacillus ihumii TaxID=2686091 RepID=UPI00157C1DCE|nr:polysaccharide deacetylase family protein [Virgibacillus ihumii]